MLIPEQEEFLRWLDHQPHGASLTQMEESNAPGFTRQRLEELYNAGFLTRETGWDLAAVYNLSDKARAALQQLDDVRRKEAHEKRQQRFTNQVSVAQVLAPLITFVLGMLAEHFSDLIGTIALLLP